MIDVLTLALSLTGDRAEATVEVAIGERTAAGRAVGVGSSTSQRRLVVAATFDALTQLEPDLADVTLGEVVTVRAGSDDVVVSTLHLWRHGVETAVAGAAVIGTRGELHAAGDALTNAVTNLR
jgi:hypothetical protein